MSDFVHTLIVIVGITGDLSTRKLLPAIEKIASSNALEGELSILGITRQDLAAKEILAKLPQKSSFPFLQKHLRMQHMDLSDLHDYNLLKESILAAKAKQQHFQVLFYLSIPPQVSQPVITLLGESGIATLPYVKLLLEKPFGTDYAAANELIEHTTSHFKESQLYRIDHYLAKEMAQNILVFRNGNTLFRRTWNKDFIEKITITASENIGIEGRATFYEQTGALRDLVQSHLLQLLALTIMEVPEHNDFAAVPQKRHEALQQLYVTTNNNTPLVIRGQYATYSQEVANLSSPTETFVQVQLHSLAPQWQGVPFVITTGKALHKKFTEVRITFKKDHLHEANELVISLQPNEGIHLSLWAKVPGHTWQVQEHNLSLAFKEHYGDLPEAYEQVFLDAIHGKHTLFTTSNEVLASWRILAPIQNYWNMQISDLVTYHNGATIDDVVNLAKQPQHPA